MLVTIVLSLSIALPGAAMASSGHHAHMMVPHSGDGAPEHVSREHGHKDPCESGDCDAEFVLTCCAMMVGHCASTGVPAGGDWSVGAALSGTTALSPGAQQLLTGQTFEADPPPPRA